MEGGFETRSLWWRDGTVRRWTAWTDPPCGPFSPPRLRVRVSVPFPFERYGSKGDPPPSLFDGSHPGWWGKGEDRKERNLDGSNWERNSLSIDRKQVPVSLAIHRTEPKTKRIGAAHRSPTHPTVSRWKGRDQGKMAGKHNQMKMAKKGWDVVLGRGRGWNAIHTIPCRTNETNQGQTDGQVRNDWTREQVADVFHTPLLELVHRAANVHRMYHDPRQVQKCTLLSIKTGGCPENCNYCSQSSHWSKETGTKATKLMAIDEIYQAAVRAKEAGSTRFCMGAAWRGPSQVGKGQFGRVLETVKKVRALGMEVCTTLGMLTPEQAQQLRLAGLTAYNHNLDTSPEYYEKVTTTRKYSDRLETLKHVREAGISICSGGIIGLGEEETDRIGLFLQLATLPEHPESVPVNSLVAVPGTPFEDHKEPTAFELVRCIATARILMPKSMVRLSAGRMKLGASDQAMCFLAGANSIFSGDELLTTKNNDEHEDALLFQQLGLEGRPAFLPYSGGGPSSSDPDLEDTEEKVESAVSQ